MERGVNGVRTFRTTPFNYEEVVLVGEPHASSPLLLKLVGLYPLNSSLLRYALIDIVGSIERC